MKKILLLLAAVAGIFTGCVPPELTLRHFPENPSAPLTVAALLPLTGENRIYAEQMLEGLLAAESRINNQNGINGRRVKLLAIDTKGSASGSSEALQKAASAGAVAAIAGYGHREVEMLTAHAAKLQMPMVLPVATGDSLTEISPFIYRSCFSDSQQMEVLASYLFHWRQLTRGAIITDSGNNAEYSLNIARHFTQAVKNNDCTIAVNCVIPQGSGLTGRQLANLLAHDPQFILIAASGRRAAEIFGKVREGGFSGVLCGPESWDDQEFLSALGKSVIPGDTVFTAFFSEENNSREFKRFRNEFRRRFYHQPGACETQSYDALCFLAIALNEAEDLFKFDRNWRSIRNHAGAGATYTMLPKGGIDRTVYLKNIGTREQNGKSYPYARLSKQLQYSKIKDYRIIE
ncbi:MAG: penicillin-binding protein activator [Lentisphaeria bacterium]|nr:penicillin-binding protein activator [Lentisphaeria bacterium]